MSMNRLASILPASQVLVGVEATSKKRAFEEAGLLFENLHGLSRALITDSLFARERLGSTGLGHGVAIPHGRIKGLKAPMAAVLQLAQPIGFDAPDWADLGYVLIGVMVFVSLLGAAWTLWERQRQDPWLRLLQRATQRLQRAGLIVPPHAPPRQLARLLGAPPTGALSKMDDTAKAALCQWLLQLEAWRYAPHSPPGGSPVQRRRALATLQRQFRQLRWPPRAR